MFNRKEITLDQYVELAKIIKESYEYLNVKKASAYYAQATSPPVSPTSISLKPLPKAQNRRSIDLHELRST
jgi:hypothetical protein